MKKDCFYNSESPNYKPELVNRQNKKPNKFDKKFVEKGNTTNLALKFDETDHSLTTSFNYTKLNNEMWIADSRCSNHMTGDITLSKNLRKIETTFIRAANGKDMKVKKGDIEINVMLKNSFIKKTLKKVLYIPDLKGKYNLISISQILKNNNGHCNFEKDKATFLNKNGEIVATTRGIGKLFVMNLQPIKQSDNALMANESLKWHIRRSLQRKQVN